MENKGSKTLSILLLVVVVVLGGYIIYDKMTKSDITPIENSEEQTKNNETIITNQSIQVLYSKVGTFIIDKDGSVYYRDPMSKYVGAEIKMSNYHSIGTYGSYKVEDYITGIGDNGELSYDFNGYKLNLENINSAYEIQIGNGGSSEIIYLLSKDGKVNELQFDSNGQKIDIKLSKDTCTKPNIVSVLQSSGFDAAEIVFVDKNGNKYTNSELSK